MRRATSGVRGGGAEPTHLSYVHLPYNPPVESGLPGADLVERGISDLAAGVETLEALLVSIGAPRLITLGLNIPSPVDNPERRLYELLVRETPESAHARYNALIRRLVSYERAAECAMRRT